MYKKWQVGFGNTSWDMDIASLKYKGEPKMDIGMSYPEYGKSHPLHQLSYLLPGSLS